MIVSLFTRLTMWLHVEFRLVQLTLPRHQTLSGFGLGPGDPKADEVLRELQPSMGEGISTALIIAVDMN